MAAPTAFTSPATDYPGEVPYADATIANGASLSGAIDLNTMIPVGIVVPSTWTAAGLSFQVSYDGTTYADLYNADGEVQVAALPTTGGHVALNPSDFIGVRFLKVRSATSGSAVNQGAARTLRVIGRRL